MKYIHQLPDWPALDWNAEVLGPKLAAVRHQQGRLLGKMEMVGFTARVESNLGTLTDDVVHSSAIEGEELDRAEVRSSIANRLGIDIGGRIPASRNVDGVVEMMVDATRNYEAPLYAERLFGWHSALFPSGMSGVDPIAVGWWRPAEAGPLRVVSGYLGRERIHFEAPAAERLPSEMEAFITWFNAPWTMDPVLIAGIAHFWFVTIHPFEDGNGRIARAIADLALARADGSGERYYSMSSQIEAERKDYYRELESAQSGELDITPWLGWFLDCLSRALESSEKKLAGTLQKAKLWEQINQSPVNPRQQTVINRMLDDFQGFLNTSKYAKLAKCSTDTALRDIQDLLDRGILLKNAAGGRSTSYRLVDIAKLLG